MPTAAGYSTVEALRLVVGLASDDTSRDSAIKLLADAQQARFESYIGRVLLKPSPDGAVTEFFDGGIDRLFPSVTPVASVTGVWADIIRQFGDGTLIAPTNYTVQDNAIYFDTFEVASFCWLPRGRGVVKVVYVGGYTDVPVDVLEAFNAELQYAWPRVTGMLGKVDATILQLLPKLADTTDLTVISSSSGGSSLQGDTRMRQLTDLRKTLLDSVRGKMSETTIMALRKYRMRSPFF